MLRRTMERPLMTSAQSILPRLDLKGRLVSAPSCSMGTESDKVVVTESAVKDMACTTCCTRAFTAARTSSVPCVHLITALRCFPMYTPTPCREKAWQ